MNQPTWSPGGFADKVAVVAGGASGIGQAVAEQLREGDARVEVADLADHEEPIDVTGTADVEHMRRRVQDRYGRCDILVNCAGAVAVGDITECSEGDWARVFDVNVRGTWLISRALLPLMPPGSAIVNVASGAGLRAIPRMAAYVAAKHAVVGLTRAMAIDHADRGIRVNCVCPGLVDTPLAHRTQRERPPEVREAVSGFEGYLIRRQAVPAELANSICFLASDGANYTTGATLAVDGGRCMH